MCRLDPNRRPLESATPDAVIELSRGGGRDAFDAAFPGGDFRPLDNHSHAEANPLPRVFPGVVLPF